MAIKTQCQTPDAIFRTSLTDSRISCSVELPMRLNLSETEAEVLEANLHNALELVLAPYFKRA